MQANQYAKQYAKQSVATHFLSETAYAPSKAKVKIRWKIWVITDEVIWRANHGDRSLELTSSFLCLAVFRGVQGMNGTEGSVLCTVDWREIEITTFIWYPKTNLLLFAILQKILTQEICSWKYHKRVNHHVKSNALRGDTHEEKESYQIFNFPLNVHSHRHVTAPETLRHVATRGSWLDVPSLARARKALRVIWLAYISSSTKNDFAAFQWEI